MSKKQFFLAIIFLMIIVFMFILPELMPDNFDKLVLLYALKDEVMADVAKPNENLTSVRYLFKLDIYLDLFSKIAAAVSLLGLLYQFKRDKNINEAEFVLNINNSFITNEQIMKMYKKLEKCKDDHPDKNPFGIDETIDLANYISFFEPFYGLVTQKVVNFSSIDQLAYRFFLVTNNKFVQEMLLCKEGKDFAWKDLYKLHYEWKKYREKKSKSQIWQKEQDLSLCPNYQKIISS